MAINTVISFPNYDGTQIPAISATAGQTDFVSTIPFSTHVDVYLNGVFQPSSSYSFTPGGFTLTWNGMALSGGEEFIIVIG